MRKPDSEGTGKTSSDKRGSNAPRRESLVSKAAESPPGESQAALAKPGSNPPPSAPKTPSSLPPRASDPPSVKPAATEGKSSLPPAAKPPETPASESTSERKSGAPQEGESAPRENKALPPPPLRHSKPNPSAPPLDAPISTRPTEPGEGLEGEGGENAKELAPKTITYRLFGLSDVGLIREHNEDNFLVADFSSEVRGIQGDAVLEGKVVEKGALFAVCDGMGGAAAGEVASELAVSTIHEILQSSPVPGDRDIFAHRLVRAIQEAGLRIFEAAKADRAQRGMGTTATVAGLIDQVLFVGQVGDSRAYVLRQGVLSLITKDQSLVNQLIEAGQLTEAEAEAFEHSNIILQALGTTEEVSVDLTFLELRRGDRLLLCSDGLSGLVSQEVLREALGSESDPKQCCKRLVELANAAGGHDNVTVIVVEFDGEGLKPAEVGSTAAYQQYPLPLAVESDDLSDATRPVSLRGRRSRTTVSEKVVYRTSYRPPSYTQAPRSVSSWLATLIVALAMSSGALSVFFARRVARSWATPVVSQAEIDAMPAEPSEASEENVVQIQVRSDIEGELFVDGTFRKPLKDSTQASFSLSPGTYLFEARSEGAVVASRLVTVAPGAPITVALMLPEGASQPVAGEGNEAAAP